MTNSDFNIISNREALMLNNLLSRPRKLKQSLPRSPMRQPKARSVDLFIYHKVKRAVQRCVDGLMLRCRIAVASFCRVLVV